MEIHVCIQRIILLYTLDTYTIYMPTEMILLVIPSTFLIESLSFVGHKLKFALSHVCVATYIDKAGK